MNPTFWNGGGGLLAGVELPTLKLCCCIGGSDIVGSGITDSVWKSLATQVRPGLDQRLSTFFSSDWTLILGCVEIKRLC